MCGIAGYLHFDRGRLADKDLVKRMTDTIFHRGPDGEGYYVNENIALGHRRLSIIDLNTGDQPMFSSSGRFVIVFNGEIYNYIELKAEIETFGVKFKTSSDTEVVLAAYELWGSNCLQKFNGMWAFAIWDILEKQLFLARDRVGEKPLHYCIYKNSFVFGSEIKPIFEFGVPKETRLDLTELYLTFTNIPAPYTFYKDVFKLMPGHFLIVKDGNVKEVKYWDLPEIDEKNMLRDKHIIYEKFAMLLEDAVRIRMRSDVTFGAFLSGGLDSSSIVALMREQARGELKTFTIGFEDRDFDETKLAALVSHKFDTTHFQQKILPQKFDSIVDKLASHFDEPFGDSSAIPTGFVAGFAAKHVKMVLTGDGGDEVLSGYTSYQGIKLSNIINQFPRIITQSVPPVNDFVSNIVKGRLRYKLNKVSSVIRTAGMPMEQKIANKMAYTDLSDIKKLCHPIKNRIQIEDYLNDLINQSGYKNDFYKLMYLNFRHDLPNDYLVKVDRMTMAHSLEGRLPFLDHRLIEFMVQVDKDVKMQGWERKSVLRNTIGKKLPDEILNAPKKGFGIPIRDWFKERSFETELNSNLKKADDLLDKSIIEKIISDNNNKVKDNGDFIWTMMMFNKFL